MWGEEKNSSFILASCRPDLTRSQANVSAAAAIGTSIGIGLGMWGDFQLGRKAITYPKKCIYHAHRLVVYDEFQHYNAFKTQLDYIMRFEKCYSTRLRL